MTEAVDSISCRFIPISFYLDSQDSSSSSLVLQDFSSPGPSEISPAGKKQSSRSTLFTPTSSLKKVELLF